MSKPDFKVAYEEEDMKPKLQLELEKVHMPNLDLNFNIDDAKDGQ